MNSKLKSNIVEFIKKHEEKLSYLFYGVLTTIVNYTSFALFRIWFGDSLIHFINVLTFVIATLFAYITNKLFVFKKRSWNFRGVLSEVASFFASRISTFLVEAVGLYVCVNIFDVGKYMLFYIDGTMAAKIILSFVAVIINYFLSKFFVFGKHDRNSKKSA